MSQGLAGERSIATADHPSPERLGWDDPAMPWPNRAHSRFVDAAGLRHHVQILGLPLGTAPVALLVHGTGASTHSFAPIAPHLGERLTLVASDLPGHGFTGTPVGSDGLSLPGMAGHLTALVRTLGIEPSIAIGHSAGAAVLARMCIDGVLAPELLISINGAFRPYRGSASGLYSSLARVLFLNPVTPRLLAWRAGDERLVARLISGTGTALSGEGLRLYGRLFRRPEHVAGALGMMASWDLRPLERDLPRLRQRVLLIACGRDDAISPEIAFDVRDRIGRASAIVEYVRDLGHLAHEERPEEIAALMLRYISGERGSSAT